MKTLHDILVDRNENYNSATYDIMKMFKDKFTSILSLLMKEDNIEVIWIDLDFISKTPELIKVSGKIIPKINEKIFDKNINNFIIINDSNKLEYIKLINLVVDVDKIETMTVFEIVQDILKNNSEDDIINDDLANLPISPTKH